MKISNLILTFILAIITSITIQGQSHSIHEVAVNNDDESIYIKYENGDVTELKVDGKTINKSNYASYQHILDQYDKNTVPNTPSTPQINKVHEDDKDKMEEKLLRKLTAFLSEKENLNINNYNLKLTSNSVRLNGKRLSRKTIFACLDIFEETAGYSLSQGSFFEVKLSPNSKSITLSLDE